MATQRILDFFATRRPEGPCLVLDLDIGHTDPQLVLPVGGECRIDPVARSVSVRY